MPEFRSDVLQPIPEHEIDKVYEIMMREWPFSGYHCMYFKTCYDWRKRNPAFDVSFFYYKDNIESGIFVAILNSGNWTFGVSIYASEGYESELKNVLLKTNIIDWNKLPLLQGVLARHTELMEDIVKIKGLNTSTYVDTSLQLLHPEKALDYEIRCPNDVYISRLTMENLDLIYDTWPCTDIHTKEDIVNSIKMSFSYGVYSKFDNELLAWVMQAHYGAIGMLYTKEHVRLHGYAKILVMVMAKKLAEEKIPPYAMIKESNTKSISLFHSIGFKQIVGMKYLKVNQE